MYIRVFFGVTKRRLYITSRLEKLSSLSYFAPCWVHLYMKSSKMAEEIHGVASNTPLDQSE